jgi:hypothetical protein
MMAVPFDDGSTIAPTEVLMKTDFFMSSDQFFYDNKYWTEHKSTLPH